MVTVSHSVEKRAGARCASLQESIAETNLPKLGETQSVLWKCKAFQLSLFHESGPRREAPMCHL